MAKHIFVVDDDSNIREIEKSYLEKEGYRVSEFETGEQTLAALSGGFPDLFVIDIMMPGMSGFELCNEIRKKQNTPIIIVSARDEELDRILGIEMGADDYMMKPFSPKELIARINAIFRRLEMNIVSYNKDYLTCRDIKVYSDERKVVKLGANEEIEIDLTAMEYNFIQFMIKNKNRVFTRDQLLTQVWGYQYMGDTRAVDDLVKRIRKKLIAADTEFSVDTVWGYGYKVTDNED